MGSEREEAIEERGGEASVVGAGDDEWGELLADAQVGDVYFSPGYHRVFEEQSGHRAELFAYREGSRFIAFPYLRRDLGELEELGLGRGGLFDITSAYGYGGPFWSAEEPDRGMWFRFHEALGEHCRRERIVSEFVRFDPMVENHFGYEDAEEANTTVYVDPTGTGKAMRRGFSPANRRNIRKAERSGIEFAELSWEESGGEFHRLYAETMERVGASDFYFFPLEFFGNHFRYLGEGAHLFGAMVRGKMVAGALCMSYGSLFHYHFGCSSAEHLNLRPNNLLFRGMIRWARGRGYRKVHLGGGYEEGDSLFRFKASFSPHRSKFFVCKRVHMEDEYGRLTRLNDERIAREGRTLSARERDFFPAYRR